MRGSADAVTAMRRIADAAVKFISRGDASGTHERERQLSSDVRVLCGLAPFDAGLCWRRAADEHLRRDCGVPQRGRPAFSELALPLRFLAESPNRLHATCREIISELPGQIGPSNCRHRTLDVVLDPHERRGGPGDVNGRITRTPVAILRLAH